MNELQIVKSEKFGELTCDIYKDDKDFYMTREQIGTALEYAQPKKAIEKLHLAHADRFSVTPQSGGHLFSVTVKLTSTDGKQYNTTLYTRKGIMEICRWSRQPKADAFMDWVWEIMDGLMTGKYKVKTSANPERLVIQDRNSRARTANAYLKIADNSALPESYRQIMLSYASKELSGQEILPLPASVQKTYSATEIGERFGVSANRIGKLASQHNLKTEEYGEWYHDKSRYSTKEVDSFRYYDSVIPVLQQLLE